MRGVDICGLILTDLKHTGTVACLLHTGKNLCCGIEFIKISMERHGLSCTIVLCKSLHACFMQTTPDKATYQSFTWFFPKVPVMASSPW